MQIAKSRSVVLRDVTDDKKDDVKKEKVTYGGVLSCFFLLIFGLNI